MNIVCPFVCFLFVLVNSAFTIPVNNPVTHEIPTWTETLPWDKAVDVTQFEGENWDEIWIKARDKAASRGGGVVYFPAGEYVFTKDVVLKDGVIIRGAEVKESAKEETYSPKTVFRFPQYNPSFEGKGTPIDTAFKTITLENPAADSRCGIVDVSILFGAIHFPDGPGHQCGSNRIVYGCRLEAAARAIPSVPQDWQHAWQRYTHRHRAAIQVYTQKNALIGNNRLATSQKHNFAMPGYRIQNHGGDIIEHDKIIFDYDNRPGIVVNGYAIGAGGGNPPDGTPTSHPHGFRKGIMIRGNAIFSTGGYAILFTGDGTICNENQIRFLPDVYRPTVTGEKLSSGSSTNGNRAVEMRGWDYTVENNEYEVYSNLAADGKYRINDGEGLMHEDHVNSTVKDSKIINNKGNTYISIYKTGGVDGLMVQDNTILSRIFVVANRNSGPYPCKNVIIEGNKTPEIILEGISEEQTNEIKYNENPGSEEGIIKNFANALLQENYGYEVMENPGE